MTNLLAEAALAADVIPPPTGVFDFLYFGVPLCFVTGALLIAAVVAVYRRFRWGGRSRPRAIFFAVLTFFAGNLVFYFVWVSFFWRPARPPRELPVPAEVVAPAPSSSGAAAPAASSSAGREP